MEKRFRVASRAAELHEPLEEPVVEQNVALVGKVALSKNGVDTYSSAAGSNTGQYICVCALSIDFFVHGVDRYFDFDGDEAAFRLKYHDSCGSNIDNMLEEVKAQ